MIALERLIFVSLLYLVSFSCFGIKFLLPYSLSPATQTQFIYCQCIFMRPLQLHLVSFVCVFVAQCLLVFSTCALLVSSHVLSPLSVRFIHCIVAFGISNVIIIVGTRTVARSCCNAVQKVQLSMCRLSCTYNTYNTCAPTLCPCRLHLCRAFLDSIHRRLSSSFVAPPFSMNILYIKRPHTSVDTCMHVCVNI